MTWLVPIGLATGILMLFWGTVGGPDRFTKRLTPYVDPGRRSNRWEDRLVVLLSRSDGLRRARRLIDRARVREKALRSDLPVALDLMSIAMIAGEGPAGALTRASQHLNGPLGEELATVLTEIRVGVPLETALLDLARRTDEPAVGRFAQALVVGLERGAPIAQTLQAHARDLREEERRSLLESGGRREILMLLPVVFLILPVIVVFVLYPGLMSIDMLVP